MTTLLYVLLTIEAGLLGFKLFSTFVPVRR